MHTSYGQMSPLQVIANILWSVLFGWYVPYDDLTASLSQSHLSRLHSARLLLPHTTAVTLPTSLDTSPHNRPLRPSLPRRTHPHHRELFLASLVSAVFLACTIVGIPFALQHLKLMRVCLAPFGLAVTKPK
mmetsp:Transcript_10624/g.28206  ORF Transcript_10624/g.28206 Transcript_10624/m.28206 type:complete len:131 (-) Transcript_10624:447-839(-)